MRPTAQELALLRERPHRTKLYLSIFRPSTILACQINNVSISRNAYLIAFDNTTSGHWTAVEAGMTLLVGTAPGLDNVGRIRVRSIISTQITVAENSHIIWQDNLYLTVLRYWEVWPVYPRIISDPADAENTLWYKDYDVPYTNQNTALGVLPSIGPHRAAFLATGAIGIYYTASGSRHVAGSAFNVSWWFEGGTPSGSSLETPGYVSYSGAGHYVTRATFTGTNFVDTAYRYVSIYDRPENGTSVPVLRWSVSSIGGGRSEGGYSTSIVINNDVVSIREGDVVVLFGESWYGSTKQTIGGNAKNNSDIFFVGHILKNSIEYNYKDSTIKFEVGSITQFMKEQEGFSISVESKASPAYWYQLYDLNIEKAIYHYLRWHSTVSTLADVQFVGDDRPLQFFDSDRASLYDAIDSLIRESVLGGVTSDMQGKIWLEHGAKAFPLVSGTYTTPTMALEKKDWIGSPRIDERFIPQTSYMEYGGIAFSGIITGTFAPLLANAPGDAPLYRGKADRQQGLALRDQNELNSLVGNLLANDNYSYKSIDYQFAGAYRNFDIAPQESVILLVESGDTPRGISISGSYIPDNINWLYDSRKQVFAPSSIIFLPLVTGSAGQTIVIPEIPDDGGFESPANKDTPVIIYGGVRNNAPTYTWIIKEPEVGGIPGPRMFQAHNPIRIDAYCVQGISVTFNLEIRDTIGVSGLNLMGTDLVATTYSGSAFSYSGTSAAGFSGTATLPAGTWLWLDISGVNGAVDQFVVTLATHG